MSARCMDCGVTTERTAYGSLVIYHTADCPDRPRHEFKHGGTGCCAICDDLPGQGEHAPREASE